MRLFTQGPIRRNEAPQVGENRVFCHLSTGMGPPNQGIRRLSPDGPPPYAVDQLAERAA